MLNIAYIKEALIDLRKVLGHEPTAEELLKYLELTTLSAGAQHTEVAYADLNKFPNLEITHSIADIFYFIWKGKGYFYIV